MLKHIETEDIEGPGTLALSPGRRDTLLTGDDNNHRRSLLDAAWCTLSGSWPGGRDPRPRNSKARAESAVAAGPEGSGIRLTVTYDGGGWIAAGRNPRPAVYADAADAIHAWIPGSADRPGRGTRLTTADLWTDRNGERWTGEPLDRETLVDLLRACIPSRYLSRIAADEHPLDAVAGRSSGAAVRRIAAVAFAAAWANRLARADGRGPGLVLMIDEPEAHLHPAWQREVIPGLRRIEAVRGWSGPLQIVAATTCPLVLASLEPTFNRGLDALWRVDTDPETGRPRAAAVEDVRRGTAGKWLRSGILGLESDRNPSAERAILTAEGLMADDRAEPERVKAADRQLRRNLRDDDHFWPRWWHYAEQVMKA